MVTQCVCEGLHQGPSGLAEWLPPTGAGEEGLLRTRISRRSNWVLLSLHFHTPVFLLMFAQHAVVCAFAGQTLFWALGGSSERESHSQPTRSYKQTHT